MMLYRQARTKGTLLNTCTMAAIAMASLWPFVPIQQSATARADTPSAQTNAADASTKTTTAATAALTQELQSVLKKLSDSNYMVRDLAMTALLANDQLTDDTIDKLYAEATTAEQRVRLRQVAVHHTARRLSLKNARPTDAAVLGMSPAPQNNLPTQNTQQTNAPESAVVVRWTFPGSVAFAHLRQGDVITLVNNKPIPATGNAGQITSAFIQLIASRRAGDEISFHVLRDGQPLDITLKLGSGNALQSIYQSARTAQSRQFNEACDKEVQDRLDALDKLSPAPKPLTLTLPGADPFVEPAADAAAAITDEAAAEREAVARLTAVVREAAARNAAAARKAAADVKPADAKRNAPKALTFDEIWGGAED